MRPSHAQLLQQLQAGAPQNIPVSRTLDRDADGFFHLNNPGRHVTKIKIPHHWGKQWNIQYISGVGCSYALNRALCRWFDIPKDELAIIHLQPTVRSYEHVDVRNAAQADTFWSAAYIPLHPIRTS